MYSVSASRGVSGVNTLVAYQTVPTEGFELVAAPHGREWMDATYERSAYHCLPLLLANQAGWLILSPTTCRVRWDGRAELGAVEIQRLGTEMQDCGCPGPPDCTLGVISHHHVAHQERPDYVWPMSHFGQGIVTWTLPYLFRTPPGYNLLVRGPANCAKDGIAPLEGLVETDWTPATFTMNWKITRLGAWITFTAGEPICMVVPQRRGELEEFAPQLRPLAEEPELDAANAQWCESRDRFNDARREPESAAATQGWEKHYFRGVAPDGTVATEHQTRLRLREFTKPTEKEK